MFIPFRVFKRTPDFNFMRFGRAMLALSGALVVLSVGVYLLRGLDLGIDFRGGTLLEVGYPQPPDLEALRADLSQLELGDVQLQSFGEEEHVLIRVQRQPGGEKEQLAAMSLIKETLGGDVDYRRSEFVGPVVGGELVRSGAYAVVFALLAMLLYIWLRFGAWQFAANAVVALAHDILLTIGIFSFLGLEFNLSTVAAILTIAGYSINDTVVIYDRIRENLKRHRSRPLEEIINISLNGTLSRTVMTSATTLLALAALFVFGGEILRGFVFAMMWGVVVGTWSSLFVASPLLRVFGFKPSDLEG